MSSGYFILDGCVWLHNLV